MKRTLLIIATTIFAATTNIFAQEVKQEVKQEEYQDDYAKANLYFKGGKLSLASNDGRFKMTLNNCIDIAAAAYMPAQSIAGLEYSNSLSGSDGQFDFSSGIMIRRVRLGARIQLYDKILADIDADFDHASVDMKDVAIRYQFHKNYSIRIGHIKEPLSVDQQASWFSQNTLERSMAIQSFTGGRRLGLSGIGYGDRWWASAGVFGSKLNALQKVANAGDDGVGGAARVVYIPINNESMLLHIGAGATYRKPDAWGGEHRVVSFSSDTESRVDGHSFIQWGVGGVDEGGYVDNYQTMSAEIAFRTKRVHLMGEYIGTSIARYDLTGDDGARKSLGRSYLSGWYAMASYMILGEQRQYVTGEAEFGAMKMRKKSGNLEVMARVSSIDFNDDAIAGYEIMGGSAMCYSAALNWFPLSNVWLSLNYVYMDNDKYADSASSITYNGDSLSNSSKWSNGIDFHTLQMRVAVSF